MAAPFQPGGAPRGDSSKVLSRDFCQVPVTALALYRAPSSGSLYVLAAEDTHLSVYDAVVPSRLPLCRCAVFAEQPIHGLHVQGGHILAWGSGEVALVSLENLEHGTIPSLVARGNASDWIYGGALSPFNASRAVLVTAHNEAVSIRQDDVDETLLVMSDPVSPSRPILSAAHVSWLSEEYVLVGGGTFFGEILVWKYQLDHHGEEAYEMLLILTGHEGSIFGLDISQPIVLDDGSTARFLASCSDDRTIRVWDVTENLADSEATAAVRSRLNDIRETGFVSISETTPAAEIDDAQITPVAMAMGHVSRIWGVRFAGQRTDTSSAVGVTMYSFGEDSTAQKWQLKLVTNPKSEGTGTKATIRDLTGSLSHEQTFALHDGKNLWSSALLDVDDQIFIATGGADGKISVIEDEPVAELRRAEVQPEKPTPYPTNKVVTLEVRDILANIPSPRKLDARKQEIINRYDYISENVILITTSWGRLLLGTFNDGLQWQEVDAEDVMAGDLKNCYVLKRFCDRAAIIGTSTGNIYFYGPVQGLVHVAKLPGRVVDVCCLQPQQPDPQSAASSGEMLIFLYGSSVGYYFALDLSNGSVQKQEEVHSLDSRFVAVSAAKVGQYLVVGSRHGWLSISKHVEGLYRSVLDIPSRSRDAVTAIVPMPSSKAGAHAYFLATNRDGKYRIYKIEEQAGSVRIHLCHEVSLPFGPFIEGAWFTEDAAPQLILYGFRSKSLVIWNETVREELATVDCGGAHRTFVLSHSSSDPASFRFAFTKTSKLCLYNQETVRHKSLKLGMHGREIRALSYNGRYLATGAEDTTVRIWDYQSTHQAKAVLQPLASMKAHVAGIQRIRWLGDDYLFSSGGNEEFFVWKIHRLDTDYAGIGVVCEGVLTDKSNDADLRIMDFDVCRLENENDIIITLGYSNTVLKSYRYDSSGSFRLVAKGAYTGACLTQVRHLGRWDNGVEVLTASTDGHLAIWEVRSDTDDTRRFHLKNTARLHQSSIKSMDIMEDVGGYRVLTGGDDNALGIAFISQLSEGTNKQVYKVSGRRIIRKAHAAAINGVLMVQRRDAETIAISISNDQRIKTWRIPEDAEGKVGLLADVYSGVADAGDVEILGRGETFVLAGVGLESWKIRISDQEALQLGRGQECEFRKQGG